MIDALLKVTWGLVRPMARSMIRKYEMLPAGFAPKKILAVRIQGAGDVLMTTPAVHALRHQFPDAEIHYLVGEQAAEILLNNLDIDKIMPISETVLFSRSVSRILPHIFAIRRQRYDLGIIFSRSAGLHGLMALCNIDFRVGFDKHGSGGMLHLPVKLGNNVRYEVLDYLELIRAIGIEGFTTEMRFSLMPKEDAHGMRLLEAEGLDAGNPFLMLSVGGGRNPGWDVPQKRWSMASFAELANLVDLPVVVVGDEIDSLEAKPWFKDNPRVVDLCGKSSLRETAALLKRAKALVTNDTVAMHMAVVMGTPTVALFGPTHPKALLPENIKNIHFLQGKSPCVPCFWQNMPHHVSNFGDSNFPGCSFGDGSSPCLDTITVSDVQTEIDHILYPIKEGKTFVKQR